MHYLLSILGALKEDFRRMKESCELGSFRLFIASERLLHCAVRGASLALPQLRGAPRRMVSSGLRAVID